LDDDLSKGIRVCGQSEAHPATHADDGLGRGGLGRPQESAAPDSPLLSLFAADVVIERPKQLWCTDFTYVPMRLGFMFLVAILDWHSRYVWPERCRTQRKALSVWTP
jgi:transposase InsO family protein